MGIDTTDLTGFVPYTGATADVDLGLNGLTANDITISGLISNRVPYTSTGGLLAYSNDLTWDNVNSTLGAKVFTLVNNPTFTATIGDQAAGLFSSAANAAVMIADGIN